MTAASFICDVGVEIHIDCTIWTCLNMSWTTSWLFTAPCLWCSHTSQYLHAVSNASL